MAQSPLIPGPLTPPEIMLVATWISEPLYGQMTSDAYEMCRDIISKNLSKEDFRKAENYFTVVWSSGWAEQAEDEYDVWNFNEIIDQIPPDESVWWVEYSGPGYECTSVVRSLMAGKNFSISLEGNGGRFTGKKISYEELINNLIQLGQDPQHPYLDP